MHELSKWCFILIWMVSFTVVTGQDCTISNFKNGSMSDSNFDTVGMEETYSDKKQIIVPCKLGFTGFFKIKCSSGHWTKVFGGICTPKSCGHPGESLNADFALVSGTDFVFASVVEYKCHEGYIMVSRNPNRICLDQGWSGNTPTCEAIKCPEITVGENVLVTGNRLQSSYGNVLQFGCRNKVLVLHGPLHIRCEGNGQWNEEPPKCDEVKCKAPDIANGKADNNTEYAERQYLKFTCNSGYSPSSRRPQCVNIRKRSGWSQTPLCERVTCQLLKVGGTTYLDVNKDRFLPGETVLVKCNRGRWFSYFDQRTQKTINCTESGEWDTDAICQEIRCQDPNDPNLKQRLQSTRMGGYAAYRCKEGFTQTDYWAICTENGWTPNPLCKVNTPCNLPTRVENAVIMEKKREVYNSGAEVTYACRTSYIMEREITIRCRSGQWSPGIPICNRVTCQLLRLRGTTYLDVNKDRFLPGETVSVECDRGYWFSYFDQRTQKTISCTESGKWDTDAICQVIRCQDPNDPNLKQRLQSKWRGDYAEYRCKEGFTQTENWARCTENGWTPNPLCKADGSELEKVEAAVVPGSSATTTAGVTCQLLQVRGTTYLDVNKDSFLPGETVSVECNRGRWFSYIDQRTQKIINCTESGEWDTAAICQEIRCEDPNDPNLKKQLSSKRKNNSTPYSCKEGFTQTNSLATCTEKGWIPNPLCEDDSSHQRPCGPPPPLPDGDISSDLKSPYQHGETVRYACHLKFTIEGEVKTCMNGQWTGETTCLTDGSELEKVEAAVVPGSSATTTAEDSSHQRTCGPPPPLPDGDISSDLKSPYQHGDTVRYACQLKFTIEGEVKTCMNGQWTGETTCLRPCTVGRQQLQPHHIKFLRDGVDELDCAHDDRLTFVCEEGFVHSLERISKVCVNGEIDLPTCHRG